MNIRLGFVLATILVCVACEPVHRGERAVSPVTESKDTPTNAQERQRWLHRVARLLRAGEGLRDPDLESRLLEKSDAQIVDYFMTQPEFGDAVLDFNLHYLGFPRDYIRESDGELSPPVFEFPSAIRSAREVLKNGDFWKLVDFEQPLYHPRLREPAGFRQSGLSMEQARAAYFEKMQAGLQSQIEHLEKNPDTPLAEACEAFLAEVREGGQLGDLGLNWLFVDVVINSNIWYGRPYEICVGSLPHDGIDFTAELRKLYATNQNLASVLKAFEPSRYSTRRLDQIKSLDVARLGIAKTWHFFGDNQRQILMNSSTNYNRKRAAYMLKTFFCDDLTPINVETPGQHTGRHGDQASCMACHYKLDPMAGFFRDFGYLFSDYSQSRWIRFDDNAIADRSVYNQSWLAPRGSGRVWDVGYIRSTSKPELNAYGSTIEDLFKIIRREPEVKRCLVKRMFSYFVNEKQAMDAGYTEYLSKQFAKLAERNSSRAFKDVTKRILLSQSFRTENPDSTVIYDFAPGYDPNGKPPGRVAFIFQKNCASCHHSTLGNGHLDLNSWVKLPNGEFSFSHLENGKQLSKRDTFSRLLQRLTTEDGSRRMPLRQYMDALERVELFKWINEYLDSEAG